jgi:alpha-beta hydrolase superfamily lysophospholipase
VPFFEGSEGKVYYRSWLAADSLATIVFLHGFGEHSGLYHRFGAALNAAKIDLWALDEIGHGLTDGARAEISSIDSLVTNARHLALLAEENRPGRAIVLAGHSLGAAAAAVAAFEQPQRYAGLVLSGAPLSPLDWIAELAGDPEAKLELDADDLSSDPFYLDGLENDPLAFTETPGPSALLSTLPPAWELLASDPGRLNLPVLLVHGEDDPIVPVEVPREWSTILPDVTLRVYPGARHDVLNETVHTEVAATIAEFARAVTSTRQVASTAVG